MTHITHTHLDGTNTKTVEESQAGRTISDWKCPASLLILSKFHSQQKQSETDECVILSLSLSCACTHTHTSCQCSKVRRILMPTEARVGGSFLVCATVTLLLKVINAIGSSEQIVLNLFS